MNSILLLCYYVVITFAFALIGLNLYKITDCFVDIKENKVFKFIAFAGLSVVATVIIYVNDIFNVIYTLIGYIILMILCYQGSIVKRVSVVMVVYPIIVSINLFVNSFDFTLGSIFGYSIDSLLVNRFDYITWNYVLALIWFGIYNMVKDKIWYAKQYINDKTWILIDIICLAPLISIILTIIFTGYNEVYRAYMIAFVCLISNIGIMFLIQYIVESVKVGLENQNYKLQYDYYNSLEEKQLEIRKINHDMNNHLQVISTYINNIDIQKAKHYFERLLQKSNSYKTKIFCENSLVNALLNSKYNLINQNEIDCHINISIDSMISIDDLDLCSIFSNSLDNAIEASLKIKEPTQRKITVKARTEKGYFSYCITNKKVNHILTRKNTILSNKQDKKNHGFGIQNIKDIVKKYNGTIDITYTDTEFTLLIII